MSYSLIEYAAFFSMFLIVLSLIITFIRLVLGPSLPDRVVALDLITMLTVGFIIAYIILTREVVYLIVVMVVALIAFLGTVAIARYLEKRVLK
ncbi:MAG: monovalent cation/H+ antiporter complex subunit F [candidate division KSB1 bacterium]|jgi:multicomponent Na+:H+ antiporter subunit F|nr:monovalent cation/H+ antiporter complex subunit F [candidate division KSB1 bacterium]